VRLAPHRLFTFPFTLFFASAFLKRAVANLRRRPFKGSFNICDSTAVSLTADYFLFKERSLAWLSQLCINKSEALVVQENTIKLQLE